MFNPFALGVCEQLLIVMAKYSQESHITTVEEVKDFFNHIVYDLDINFHPDDDFKNYVSYETGSRTMDDKQAELYNRLMDESFEVCGDEVYEIGSDLLFKRLQIEAKWSKGKYSVFGILDWLIKQNYHFAETSVGQAIGCLRSYGRGQLDCCLMWAVVGLA